MENQKETLVPFTDAEARIIYKAHPDFREPLERKFGKAFFSTNPIDRIKTLEDACSELGIDYNNHLPYPDPKSKHQEGVNAFAVVSIIQEALCGEWVADWNNHSQYKYYPYFSSGSGLGLAFSLYCDTYYITTVGSRLVYPTKELAKYAGTQFEKEYIKFLTK